MVYFRAAIQGACTYMDDRRNARMPHGTCWYDLCDDLEVLDIPGDHFSILRQVSSMFLVCLPSAAGRPTSWQTRVPPVPPTSQNMCRV